MKLKNVIVLTAIATMLNRQADAQTYDTNGDYVQTFAGSGFSGYADGVRQQTMFNGPNSIVADSHSNLFVWASGNYRIREIAPDGIVTTFAGGGSQAAGFGTNVNLPSAQNFGGMAIDHSNALWITADTIGAGGIGSLIRIGPDGYVSSTNALYFTYSVNGGFRLISGICVDSENNVYYTDYLGNKIYRYVPSTGIAAVFAGSGNSGYEDGNGIFTAFSQPAALACDQADNIYVWDSGNRLIRRIDQSHDVTTFAGNYFYTGTSNVDGVGTNAVFYFTSFNTYATYISQMYLDNSGNLYLACGNCIRKISVTTNVVTMAGSFTQTGYTNGAGNFALFNGVDGVCIAGGTLYVADSGNQRVRDITFNPVPQVVSGANLGIGTFAGVTITGIVGRTYQIQSSPDMNTWNTVATVLLNSSPYLWIDQNPVSGNKFYRAVLMP